MKSRNPIGDWDVSNVTDMAEMFLAAHYFNQPIGNWNVSKVANMNYMFYKATHFKQFIGNWNVSSVETYNNFAPGLSDGDRPNFVENN